MRILHVTFDGLLQPLGGSQVVLPTLRLAEAGFPYALVSLERRADLASVERVRAMEERLEAAGVPWFRHPYAEGGARAAMRNLRTMTREVIRLCRRLDVRLIHARAYHAGFVARTIQPITGVPYLFDARGCWFDELRQEGRWGMDRPLPYALGKAIERVLFEGAAGAVCLTETMTRDVQRGAYGRWPAGRPIRTIPTCTDYERFADPPESPRVRALREQLGGGVVIGYVGALNRSYDVESSMKLFRAVHARRPDARLLCLTTQLDAMREVIRRHGVPEEAALVASVPHEEVPAAIRLLHWGLLLLRPGPLQDGKMPTKLAEFFAAGVRPVHGGGNPEVGAWVERAGSGLRLPDLSEASIARAADRIASASGQDDGDLARARERTESHFSLSSGVRRYGELLEELSVPRLAPHQGRTNPPEITIR
jgi:glycosyltransferase involved in cell wall biosynthesis